MARKPTVDKEGRGSKKERGVFKRVQQHYEMAVEDLDTRIPDWDKKDELFRSHINEADYPYNSVVFDPRVFTSVFEKTARLLANKPRGRLVPREGGDTLGAQINNEILSFQWDDNERVDGQPMLAKWAMMDQNARKYGASFALVKWRYERGKAGSEVDYFDGPDFKPLVNRDCLPNPSYSTVKQWFQYREYVTLSELEDVNDAARTEPVYKNLDILRDSLKEDGAGVSDRRDTNWISKNKSIKGLQDQLGEDEANRVVEVVTEYSQDRWVTFAPKHGIILRDIPNPYDHQQIPVVMLRYYQVDDDLYGLSEIEPVERLQRATNALINQYIDSINISLYVPLKVRATGVQMHTLEFGPGKKWIMNDPATDVMPHESSGKGVAEFTSTYRFMIGAMQEALGETSAAISSLEPGQERKTATEVRDLALQRNARDNYNQLFLAEALKKQMMFWFVMNRQFYFSDPNVKTRILRIVGRDALRFFQKLGLDKMDTSSDTAKRITGLDETLLQEVDIPKLATPVFPVETEDGIVPKLDMDISEEMGSLVIVPEDLSGNYDYIPDIESMSLPDDSQIIAVQKQFLDMLQQPTLQQYLQQDGYKVNFKELLEDFLEKVGMKDAEKYFEKAKEVNEANQGGIPSPGAGIPNQGDVNDAGMGQSPEAMAPSQAGQELSRPRYF